MRGQTNAGAIEYNETIREVIRLRRDGLTYDEIERRTGIKAKTAQKAVSRALERALLDDAKDLKRLQLARLEKLIEILTPALAEVVVEGVRIDGVNFFAVDRYIKALDRQAKLLGLDSPVKVAETDTDGNDKPAGEIVFYLPSNGRDTDNEADEADEAGQPN